MPIALSVDRIQGLSGSLAIKVPVDCATVAAITLSGLQTIDDVVLVEGDRVLVKDQTDLTTNGLYTATTSTWQRTLDFNNSNDAIQGTLIHVYGGTTNAGLWMLTTSDPVIGTSDLEFAWFATGGGGSGGGSGGVCTSYFSNFTGDGSTTTFTLASSPPSIADTLVIVDAIAMVPNTDYTLTNDSITFLTEAPFDGAPIYVNYTVCSSTATTTLLSHRLTAVGGETAIALPYTYTPGSATVAVYRNGLRLYPITHFEETDASTVTLNDAALAGDEYYFLIGQLVNDGDTIVVADGTITTNKLVDDAVTTDKILDEAITLAKVQNIATTKLLGRATAGTGDVEEVTITSFTAEATLDANADYLLLWDTSAGLHKKVLLGNVSGAGSLGVAQTWQNMTGSRVTAHPYQNLTGRAIAVSITSTGTSGSIRVSSDGVTYVEVCSSSGTESTGPLFAIVPNGHYYKHGQVGGAINLWSELR
jgi:hypothetical protein